MPQRQSIRDIRPGEDVRTTLLIGTAALQQSRNGPYWRLELRDATGAVEAKIWSPLSAAFTDLTAGQLVDIVARAGLFRDQLQLTVEQLRVLDETESALLDMADFLPASPRPAREMLAEAEELCRRVLTHEPWRRFVFSVLEDPGLRTRLLTAPAAKNVHHAYAGGLLEHSLSVASLCMRMADHYPELDRQTLLAGALFHDIGKLDEMSGGLANDYTDGGRFLGHIAQGLLLLEPFLRESGLEPELALHFRHLIASHHGELEFGSPRQPATAEAFALHYADNVDAKIAQWRGLFPAEPTRAEAEASPADSEQPGMKWSPWQNLLGRSLCRPVRTPTGDAGSDAPYLPGGTSAAQEEPDTATDGRDNPDARSSRQRRHAAARHAEREGNAAEPETGVRAPDGPKSVQDSGSESPEPSAASAKHRDDRQCSLL